MKKVSFSSKPTSIFPSYRPMLRLAQILLVLKINSIGNKASLLKLHLFSWAFKEHRNLQLLAKVAESDFQEKIQFIGIEPSLNRALHFALYEGLIRFNGKLYVIEEKGNLLVESIIKDATLFEKEKPLLMGIGKKLNEHKLTELQKLWQNA